MFQNVNICPSFMRIFAQIATPLTGPWNPLKQPQHMARHMPQIGSLTQFTLNIRVHGAHHGNRIGIFGGSSKNLTVNGRQNS